MRTPASDLEKPETNPDLLPIDGYKKKDQGAYEIQAQGTDYHGAQLSIEPSDEETVYRLTWRKRTYRVVLNRALRVSMVSVDGEMHSMLKAGQEKLRPEAAAEVAAASEPVDVSTLSPAAETYYENVIVPTRVIGSFTEHLIQNRVLPRTFPGQSQTRRFDAKEVSASCSTGTAKDAARIGYGYWIRGFAFAATESEACYWATDNANIKCSNNCCVGCAELLSCDNICTAGSYICEAGVWGRACGEGEGSCPSTTSGQGVSGGGGSNDDVPEFTVYDDGGVLNGGSTCVRVTIHSDDGSISSRLCCGTTEEIIDCGFN